MTRWMAFACIPFLVLYGLWFYWLGQRNEARRILRQMEGERKAMRP